MEFYQRTHVGKIRSNNEDYLEVLKLEEDMSLLIVADGMGGHNKGEVASKLATEMVIEAIKEDCKLKIEQIKSDPKLGALCLTEAIRKSNAIVYGKSMEEDFFGMGTTLVCALIVKGKLLISNVGDSRCYILRNANLKQLTKDNSYVQELVESGAISQEEALHHAKKNVITRAVGTDSSVVVDNYEYSLYKGDRILLCTDGLSNMLMDEDIQNILNTNMDIESCGDLLIEEALKAGGLDNVSLLLADYNDEVNV